MILPDWLRDVAAARVDTDAVSVDSFVKGLGAKLIILQSEGRRTVYFSNVMFRKQIENVIYVHVVSSSTTRVDKSNANRGKDNVRLEVGQYKLYQY